MKNRIALLLLSLYFLGSISCRNGSDAPEAEVTEPAIAKDAPPKARKYIADTLGSTIEWMGSKPTGTHTGTISIAEGELFVKNDSLETGKFTIDMTSITVTDPASGKDKVNLENHLKGLGKEGDADHFFNTIKYPIGTFEITGTALENGKNIIEGNLTLKGITKNIKFPAAFTVNDTMALLISDSFKINRILWNINYSSKSAVENLGNQYIDDNIEIKVRLIARRD